MTTFQTPDQIERMLRDTGGVRVELDWDQTYGHFEIVDELAISESEVLIGAPTLLIATGKLPKLAIDKTLLLFDEEENDVDEYLVRSWRRLDDGGVTRILLREP